MSRAVAKGEGSPVETSHWIAAMPAAFTAFSERSSQAPKGKRRKRDPVVRPSARKVASGARISRARRSSSTVLRLAWVQVWFSTSKRGSFASSP